MSIFKTVLDSLIAARRRAAAIRELQNYDDHLLHDIGITRSEIEDYVDGRLAWDTRGERAQAPAETATLPAAA